ncbi:Interferon-induced 35 kDa protein -like protein [Channa argus]|uniref:Interferon-induced 35 kDa protein-like protein n=1 Tax=Channa argus TaxID=215402 RepID=A0A6G1QB81_CHAAH|nr:Interferon-induced 35 kDa protein -like protein [Channa argus]
MKLSFKLTRCETYCLIVYEFLQATFTMSSDEDFSLVVDNVQQSQDTLEGTKALIAKYKKQYDQLLQEHNELCNATDEQRNLAQQFKKRAEKLAKTIAVDQQSYKEQIGNEKAKLRCLKEELTDLVGQIQRAQAALEEEEATNQHLREQSEVFSAVPEKELVFTGLTLDAADKQRFQMKSHIVYPMAEGTALVTFEEEDVAQNILRLKTHRVGLGEECRITVEARPVQLMVPTLVEIDSEICPRRILLSNLPKMDTETMLNRLEIHFSKSKNGGGEVEDCEMLTDTGTVVITFLENNIARHLTDKEYHEVMLKEKHRVRATPFLNGNITNLKTKMSMSSRTVLLTGIPDVMDRDILQDLLEIHFQKNSNGGGEIEAFLYNPIGEQTSAVFKGISPKTEEK